MESLTKLYRRRVLHGQLWTGATSLFAALSFLGLFMPSGNGGYYGFVFNTIVFGGLALLCWHDLKESKEALKEHLANPAL